MLLSCLCSSDRGPQRLLNMYPERFALLPPELFTRLMSTLLFAVRCSDEKVQLCAIKVCLFLACRSLFSSLCRG